MAASPTVSVERLERFRGADLPDICDAAVLAIEAGGSFGWIEPPSRDVLERYWRGVLAVPGRSLFVGRLDGTIAGSAQLVRPSASSEAWGFAAYVTNCFVAPWARGHGLARRLTEAVEAEAAADRYTVLQVHIRETQTTAIRLFEAMGYVYWGTNPYYTRIGGRIISGCYYYKLLGEPKAPVGSDDR